jgi:hypothetical protein
MAKAQRFAEEILFSMEFMEVRGDPGLKPFRMAPVFTGLKPGASTLASNLLAISTLASKLFAKCV